MAFKVASLKERRRYAKENMIDHLKNVLTEPPFAMPQAKTFKSGTRRLCISAILLKVLIVLKFKICLKLKHCTGDSLIECAFYKYRGQLQKYADKLSYSGSTAYLKPLSFYQFTNDSKKTYKMRSSYTKIVA